MTEALTLSGTRASASAILALPRERFERALEMRDWLLETGRQIAETNQVVEGVAERLRDCGLPLDRMTTAVEVRHSQHSGVGRVWELGKPAREILFRHGEASRVGYHRSPFRVAHESGEWVRLDVAATPDQTFDIVPELKGGGYTDYFCVPVLLSNGMQNGFSFATRARDGFSADDLTVLGFMMPALAALMELLVTRRILTEVAQIYLGAEPARRVLAGDVRRGHLVEIRSVIMFADMRRFTETSMRLSNVETVDLLNHYYDCVVGPVEALGGAILKFVADGLLAIFRAEEGAEAEACARAWQASDRSLAAVDALNAAGTAPARFAIGIGLHLGIAGYGNVGSGERQDYTVIGRDVNLGSRIAGLCGPLGRPLLFSQAFAEHVDVGLAAEIGRYPLKGVPGEPAIFAPTRA